jgi:ABC-2 type transport system ATP-binding protein
MTHAIELRGLTKDYGSLRALDNVSLTVEPGEVFGFLGPNGAGKTTTIRVIFDLIRPTAGAAFVMGLNCQTESLQTREHMGYLAGDFRVYEDLTGQQALDFFSSLRGVVDQGYVREMAQRLDFDTSRVIRTYSKGNRQKLGILLALMHRPSLLVLDEPTSGLDPLVQETFEDIITKFAADGGTVFFSSHVLSEVEHLCHRAAFLRDGKLVAVEDIGAIKGRSLHVLEVTFDAPVSPNEFEIDGVRVIDARDATLQLEARDNLDAVLKQVARHTVIDLRTEQPSLEATFRAYYEGTEETAGAEESQREEHIGDAAS